MAPRKGERHSGQFKPGNRANPGGMPTDIAQLIRDIKHVAAGHAPEALKALVDIANNGESESARVQAANAILDRACGKPTQMVTGEEGGPVRIQIVTNAGE